MLRPSCTPERRRNPVGVVTRNEPPPRVVALLQPWAVRRNPFGICRNKCPNSRMSSPRFFGEGLGQSVAATALWLGCEESSGREDHFQRVAKAGSTLRSAPAVHSVRGNYGSARPSRATGYPPALPRHL